MEESSKVSLIQVFGFLLVTFILLEKKLCECQGIAPDNLISTGQIVIKSCYIPGVHSEKVAWQFIGCYDWAPGKQQFFTCQRRIFNGRLFDSVRNIRKNCSAPQLIPKYASCIMREFKKAGLDMNKAVRKLNACQLNIFK